MTHDDDLDQPELRELLAERAHVSPTEVEPLRRFVAELPPRRRSWGRGILAAAAGIVVLLAGLGVLAILTVRWGSSGAGPMPPNPAYFTDDPRLAVCNAKATDAEAIFELVHLSDYGVQLPNAYPLTGLQANPSDPVLVIVLKGPATPQRAGETPMPGSHDLCLVVGERVAQETGIETRIWQQVAVVDVDTTGLQAFKPEATGSPIAADLRPWVNACGGESAGISRVLQLPHGTDAMTLNSIQVPISLMTDEPMTIVVYDAGHPFGPLGTPSTPGTTVAPRQPGYQDLCILVGSDPATARRTVVEVGPSGQLPDAPSAVPSTVPSGGAAGSSPSVAPTSGAPAGSPAPDGPSASVPPASPSSILQPQIAAADCAALGLSDARCLAVVGAARSAAGLDWTQITAVRLAKPDPTIAMTTTPIATVTFSLNDASPVAQLVACGLGGQYDPACTDHPEIRVSTPVGGLVGQLVLFRGGTSAEPWGRY